MASRGYNHVVLVGNLGRDPELRTLPGGSNVCTFSLATTEKYKNKNGELQDRTDWHNIEIWGNLADTASKYLKKGKTLLVEGQIRNDNYEKDGVKHYAYKIFVRSFTMLDSKASSDHSDYSLSDNSYSQDEFENKANKISNDDYEIATNQVSEDSDDDDMPF